MKTQFEYNKEKDIWCLLNKGKSSNNSSYPTKVYERLIMEQGENPTHDVTSIFIDSYLAKNDIATQEYINKYQSDWDTVADTYHKKAEEIFNISLPQNITAYLTINNRCPYSINENYFFVSFPQDSVRRTIMHELWHFYTWYGLGIDQEERLGKEKYNDLKEALTVLLNVEYKDLMSQGAHDAGYPQHKELREKILEFWVKDRDIYSLWNYLVKALDSKEIPIREIGKFFDKDLEGYLINPASKEKITEEWQPVVSDIIETYKSHYGDVLHSVYIRGSVAKGDAVPNISDVDTFAYVTLKEAEIKKDWMDSFEKEMSVKYPFVQGVELSVDPIEDAHNDRILILQSACVYGNDLNTEMPKIKVGKETLGHVYSLSKNLVWFDEWAVKPQTSEEIKKSCTWLMKRFLRTGLELTMERAGQYTRDLYPSYKLFSEYYPEKEVEMKEILYLALNPTDNLDIIKKVRDSLGVWLEEQAREYKRNDE